ncbi:MAG: winged helix-turn-helix transcriptional regulator [Acidobacteria bacterium]|nr:winged helix-turn-helix transcriptional regulator [Acidobacteriota bacterium]
MFTREASFSMANNADNALCSLFLALSDPTRLKLIRLMAGDERSVGFLAEHLGESQPKISRHLAFLRDHSVVTTRREGKHIYYRINDASAEDSAVLCVVTGERPISSLQSNPDGPSQHIRPYAYVTSDDELPVFLL